MSKLELYNFNIYYNINDRVYVDVSDDGRSYGSFYYFGHEPDFQSGIVIEANRRYVKALVNNKKIVVVPKSSVKPVISKNRILMINYPHKPATTTKQKKNTHRLVYVLPTLFLLLVVFSIFGPY